MSRIRIPTIELSPPKSKPLLDAVQAQLGVVPNLMRLVGHSPAALEGYLALNGALAKGVIDAKLRESIALAVAEFNGCEYCLSAHTYLALNLAKLGEPDIRAAREAVDDPERCPAVAAAWKASTATSAMPISRHYAAASITLASSRSC
jgi:AhpD family alkylhydroperoxidase